MRYKINWIQNIVTALLVLIIEFFVVSYNFWWLAILVAPSVILLSVFFELKLSYFIVGIVGLGLSFFSIWPIGINFIILAIFYLFAKYFLNRWFSNTSYGAMFLFVILGLIFYQLEIIIFNFFLYRLDLMQIRIVFDKLYFADLLWQVLGSLVFILLLTFIFKLNRKHYYV